MSEATVRTEEFIVVGDAQVFKVKEVVHKGNLRRITIKNEEEKNDRDFAHSGSSKGDPLTHISSHCAGAALVEDCTIVVEKVEE